MSLESTKNVGVILKWVFMVVPSFSLCFGICDISFRDLFALVNQRPAYEPMDIRCAGGEALFLGISIIVFGSLHVLMEGGVFKWRVWPDAIPAIGEEFLDEDVQTEN